jgi:hypothetical protein
MAFKDRFEKKDYALTEETMRKAGDLGFLSVRFLKLTVEWEWDL